MQRELPKRALAIAFNKASSGPLVSANSRDGIALFTGYDLRPGESRAGRVTIANKGLEAGEMFLSERRSSNDFEPGQLTLRIEENRGGESRVVYEGGIGDVPAAGIDLGDYEADEERVYRFLVTLSADAPHCVFGRGAGAAYEWDAVVG
jgi:hypothetical protein